MQRKPPMTSRMSPGDLAWGLHVVLMPEQKYELFCSCAAVLMNEIARLELLGMLFPLCSALTAQKNVHVRSSVMFLKQ